MSKFVERNISELKKLKRKQINDKTTQANKKRIDEIIRFYIERKLPNVATAENYTKGLTSTNKKVYDNTFQKHKDNISKLKETKPLKERMAEAKKKKEKKTYFVDYMLYTYFKGDLKKSNIKQKQAFTCQGIHFFTVNIEITTATVEALDFPKEWIGKRIFRWTDFERWGDIRYESKEWKEVIGLMSNDEDLDSNIQHLTMYYDDLGCIKIRKVELVNRDGEHFNIMTENLAGAEHVSIYHRHTNTPVQMEAPTIKEAIQKGHYQKICVG